MWANVTVLAGRGVCGQAQGRLSCVVRVCGMGYRYVGSGRRLFGGDWALAPVSPPLFHLAPLEISHFLPTCTMLVIN